MGHQINSGNSQHSPAIFVKAGFEQGGDQWQPPGQAKKHQHAAADNSLGSSADAIHTRSLNDKPGSMVVAVQQNDPKPKVSAPTEEEIKQQVAAAAAALVADRQLWKQHEALNMAVLKNIVANPSQHPPSTVRAAQTMLDHPAYFSHAVHGQGHDHKHGRGHGHAYGHDHNNGEVRRDDLIKLVKSLVGNEAMHRLVAGDAKEIARYQAAALAAVAARAEHQVGVQQLGGKDAEQAEVAAARQVLQADASLWVGKTSLSVHDLQDILKNSTQHPPETVRAALQILQHPAAFANATISAS